MHLSNHPSIQLSIHPTILSAANPATNFQILIIEESLKYFDKKNEDLIEDTIHPTCHNESRLVGGSRTCLASYLLCIAFNYFLFLVFFFLIFLFFGTNFKPVPILTRSCSNGKLNFKNLNSNVLIFLTIFINNFFGKYLMNEILTVLKAVELSAEYLKKKGIDEARPNAELLLANILNCKRLDLYLQFDRPLNEKEKQIYREHLSRRANGEPLQYITGEVEFYGLTLKVNPSVLIPRPETELLVEKIIKENKERETLKILDVGTGSGNIAIALKANLPNAEIFSIDISEKAIETAKANAELNGLAEDVTFETADIFDESVVAELHGFDIIVSNPPYVSKEEMEDVQKEIKDYEPREAVTDSANGLKFFNRISSVAKMILNENGKIYFEVGKGESEKVSAILNEEGFKNIETQKDFSGIPRIVEGEL